MSEALKAGTREAPGEVSADYLGSIRQYLRIASSDFDGEIGDLINAARGDLILGGVLPDKAKDETDPLIKRAVATYVKAEFGLDNPDADRLRESYRHLKIGLALASDYVGEGEG